MSEGNPDAPEPARSERKIETFEDCDIGPGSRLPDRGDTAIEFGDVHYSKTESEMDYIVAKTVRRDGQVNKEGKLLLDRVVEYMRGHPDVQVDNAHRRPLSDEARQAKARRAELEDIVSDFVPQDQLKSAPADIVEDALEKAVKDRAMERFPDTVDDFLQGQAKDKVTMRDKTGRSRTAAEVKNSDKQKQTGGEVEAYKRKVQAESQQKIDQIKAYYDERVARLREQREAAKIQHVQNLRVQTEQAVENMRKSSMPDSIKEAAIEAFYQSLKESIEKAEKE